MPTYFHHQDMDPWVDEFGSSRLKKAKACNLLSESIGAYRAERLAFEMPGWEYIGDEMWTPKERRERFATIRNPSEPALDALIRARELYNDSNIYLSSYFPGDGGRQEWLLTQFLGRLTGVSVAAWHDEETPEVMRVRGAS